MHKKCSHSKISDRSLHISHLAQLQWAHHHHPAQPKPAHLAASISNSFFHSNQPEKETHPQFICSWSLRTPSINSWVAFREPTLETEQKVPYKSSATQPWRVWGCLGESLLSLGMREDGGRLVFRNMWVINCARFHLKRKTVFPNFSCKGKKTYPWRTKWKKMSVGSLTWVTLLTTKGHQTSLLWVGRKFSGRCRNWDLGDMLTPFPEHLWKGRCVENPFHMEYSPQWRLTPPKSWSSRCTKNNSITHTFTPIHKIKPVYHLSLPDRRRSSWGEFLGEPAWHWCFPKWGLSNKMKQSLQSPAELHTSCAGCLPPTSVTALNHVWALPRSWSDQSTFSLERQRNWNKQRKKFCLYEYNSQDSRAFPQLYITNKKELQKPHY